MLKLAHVLGNTLAPTGQQYDSKSGQWFGALLQSSGADGTILVSFIFLLLLYR
jgi:hypothetical protein